MKFLTTLLIALMVAVGIYAARRRLILALKTGAVVYMILLPLRLLFAAGSSLDRLDELLGPGLVLLLVWCVLWRVSTAYERNKQQKRAEQIAAGKVSRSRRRLLG